MSGKSAVVSLRATCLSSHHTALNHVLHDAPVCLARFFPCVTNAEFTCTLAVRHVSSTYTPEFQYERLPTCLPACLPARPPACLPARLPARTHARRHTRTHACRTLHSRGPRGERSTDASPPPGSEEAGNSGVLGPAAPRPGQARAAPGETIAVNSKSSNPEKWGPDPWRFELFEGTSDVEAGNGSRIRAPRLEDSRVELMGSDRDHKAEMRRTKHRVCQDNHASKR